MSLINSIANCILLKLQDEMNKSLLTLQSVISRINSNQTSEETNEILASQVHEVFVSVQLEATVAVQV